MERAGISEGAAVIVLSAAVLSAVVSSLLDAESVLEATAEDVALGLPALVDFSVSLAVSEESGGRLSPSFWASIGEARSRVDARMRLLEIRIVQYRRNWLNG